jgi:hypothetical protein
MADTEQKQESPSLTPFQLEMAAYRRSLLSHESTMQSDFDKYILSLSSGALALSITFLKEVLNQQWTVAFWLMGAWVFWATSICCIVISFITSAKAMRTAVSQTDDMLLYKAANDGNLGGIWNKVTNYLNVIGGVTFLVGVVCMVVFSACNLTKGKDTGIVKQKSSATG